MLWNGILNSGIDLQILRLRKASTEYLIDRILYDLALAK